MSTPSRWFPAPLLVFPLALSLVLGPSQVKGQSLKEEVSDRAVAYCQEQGGFVETRYPAYSNPSNRPTRLAGSHPFCRFSNARNATSVWVAIDTLYATEPTLAAIAYRAAAPHDRTSATGQNAAAAYCAQVGGTSGNGGGEVVWVLETAPANTIAMCVFPDRSMMDVQGLAFRAQRIIRGADLNRLFHNRTP